MHCLIDFFTHDSSVFVSYALIISYRKAKNSNYIPLLNFKLILQFALVETFLPRRGINFWMAWGVVKCPAIETGQARSLFLYHILCSFYNPFITTLRMEVELDIQILINLSNRNIIPHYVFVQLYIIHNSIQDALACIQDTLSINL